MSNSLWTHSILTQINNMVTFLNYFLFYCVLPKVTVLKHQQLWIQDTRKTVLFLEPWGGGGRGISTGVLVLLSWVEIWQIVIFFELLRKRVILGGTEIISIIFFWGGGVIWKFALFFCGFWKNKLQN